MQQDTLHLTGIKLPDGTELKDEWYTVVGLNDIEAIYELDNGRINAIDHGALGQDDENTIMTEAPVHYMVMSGAFSGELKIEERPEYSLVFKNNQLIDIK